VPDLKLVKGDKSEAPFVRRFICLNCDAEAGSEEEFATLGHAFGTPCPERGA
jgi:hypothetical protein